MPFRNFSFSPNELLFEKVLVSQSCSHPPLPFATLSARLSHPATFCTEKTQWQSSARSTLRWDTPGMLRSWTWEQLPQPGWDRLQWSMGLHSLDRWQHGRTWMWQGGVTWSWQCLPGLGGPLQRGHPARASCADWNNVQPLWRLSLFSSKESIKGAKKRDKKLSAWLGKTWLAINSKQFSRTKTSW